MKYSTLQHLVPLVGFLLVLPCHAGEWKVLTPAELSKLMQQAVNGNRKAQSRIGLALAMGQEMPQNYCEAVKWLSAAAERGDPAAEHNLALMYYNGTGVSRDEMQAASWFERKRLRQVSRRRNTIWPGSMKKESASLRTTTKL